MVTIYALRKCSSNPSVIRLLKPLYRSMYHPFINKLLRPFLGRMQFVLGTMGIMTPVVGRLKFRLFDGKAFYMESDGYDGIINMLYGMAWTHLRVKPSPISSNWFLDLDQ